jgi:hypothetical protein
LVDDRQWIGMGHVFNLQFTGSNEKGHYC